MFLAGICSGRAGCVQEVPPGCRDMLPEGYINAANCEILDNEAGDGATTYYFYFAAVMAAVLVGFYNFISEKIWRLFVEAWYQLSQWC
uniref:AlNc14C212G8945 protein n=1 Tax=Albugo laibachii Nc14 TaxID=890382 RepID=F0WRE1_9STRA|nr:AlNc14C212G8945 [Albugo laibachii Nc14]|eukprot:CCA23904.1 AlNc14C212G8945 [Albugo laibachii Nc14]